MLHRHILEVGELDPRPHHEVLRQAGDIGVLETFLWRRALKVGHGGEEERHVGGCEDALIGCDTRDDGAVLGLQVDVLDEKFIPFCRRGTEDG